MMLAAALALAASPIGAAVPAPADPHVIFNDAARQASVRYDFTPADVIFSANLPAGWSFSVDIDGDQNGQWGAGPESNAIDVRPTPDRAFGQDSRNGVFCSQYILSSDPQEPDDVYSSSECGMLPSKGVVEMTGFDAQMHATIRFKIPYDEIFGSRRDAHLRVCIWDTHRRTCQFSPAKPYILNRPPGR
jgi:hypothetical protein